MFLLIWLTVLLVSLVFYLREVYSRFSKYEVKCITPMPLLGNVGRVALRKWHIGEDVQNLYNSFPNERFLGRFELMRPVVVITDLELIKQITIKNFEYFIDHRNMVDPSVDTLFGRNLFSLKGQEWKDMRSALSPAFTASKMRAMVPFMVDVNKQMIKSVMKKIEELKSGYIDVDTKDLITRCTNDVIASCAFGFKVDSHEDPENEFYWYGRSISKFDFRKMLVYLGYTSFPGLLKKFNVKMFSGESTDYFKNLFSNAVSERETKNIFRPDMIHLLLEAKKGNLRHEQEDQGQDFATAEDMDKEIVTRTWSDSDLIAQAVFFFVAGFESVSSGMCFLLHELAVNADVQERLANEISENDAKNDGNFDYNSVQNLNYLDMVISEVLRLWPVAVGLDRVCAKNCNLGKPNDTVQNDFIVHKGESILVPVLSIHRDPKYFPNPEKFNPERFSEQNKSNIKPFSYMPFGLGPRNCIGARFAICEMKVMAYQLLQRFELTPCERTRIPAGLSAETFTLAMAGGHWLRFRPRNGVVGFKN